MTSTPFQDDFHREVEPATDKHIENGKRQALKAKAFGLNVEIDPDQFMSLLARIRAEREQTIRECAEIARTATMFTGCPLECMADEVRDAVLSLLQSNGEDK